MLNSFIGCSYRAFIILYLSSWASGANHLIKHYQELTSDKISYTYNTRHTRRSTLYTAPAEHLDEDLVIHVTLSDTPYTLMLTKVQPPLRNYDNVTVNGHHVDVDRFYDGFVSGFPASSNVRGFINSKGNFEGHITVRNETWVIESSELVLDKDADKETINRSPTVAFKESDMDPVNFHGLCGTSGSYPGLPLDFKVDRSLRQTKAPPVKNTCEILVVVDHTFSEAYNNDFNDITHAVTYFVKEADNIFQSTVFGDTKGYMITIGRFEIYTPDRVNDKDYPFR